MPPVSLWNFIQASHWSAGRFLELPTQFVAETDAAESGAST